MSYTKFDELLRAHGTSVYRVSKATGISASTFTDWKNGRSVPKADKMKRIADFFGVTLDTLLGATNAEAELSGYSVAMNIQRSVASATKHIKIIEDLKSAKLFDDMPDDLKLTACLRLENPEMSLLELAGIHKPAISKSGLNHRLAKITEYATKHGIV